MSRAETERSVQSDMGTGRVLARRIADSVVFRTMVGIMILINVSALACFHRNVSALLILCDVCVCVFLPDLLAFNFFFFFFLP